ncbi:YgzB family protein [Shouchella sp. JSM 1781072]|uniref:YgzB family protein n=1 Tax=Bacillaceae TaxID=186817 RepID=UPI0020D19ABE|nr:YgzB family protein [Alkalihalobacillus sp. LMS6]UTR07704.1 YgzB family protein [Alkalihalobacillus sp. LMS6]
MGLKYSNKINKIRTFALSLVFIGILIMYIGIFFRDYPVVMIIAMILGLLAVIGSTVVYFFIGMLSTRAVPVVCPSCEKPTKVLGRVDACMHCDQPLTMDRSLEGQDFDESYNSKKASHHEA